MYGVVHPASRAVGVVAIDERDRVLLVGQYRYTLDRYSWELPEGGVPDDEDLLDGARQRARRGDRLPGRDVARAAEVLDAELLLRPAGSALSRHRSRGGRTPDPDGTEDLRLRWVDLAEAVDLVRGGELFDNVTQLGVLFVGAGARSGVEARVFRLTCGFGGHAR